MKRSNKMWMENKQFMVSEEQNRCAALAAAQPQ